MRIALFGSGSPLSVSAFRRLSRAGRSPAVVVVPPAAYAKPLIDIAREHRIDSLEFGPAVAARLRALAIDLICIASFPSMLRGALLEFPAINLHTSLLPRHRGVDPIFWTYYYGEETTGVTIHWVDAECDSGDIIVQRSVALPAGKPSRELYFELCEIGSDLLGEALDAIESGRAQRIGQDATQATLDPAPKPDNMRADFRSWPVRRAWHYLAGMSDQRSDLLVDGTGTLVRHGRALSWREEVTESAEAIEKNRDSIEVHCRDGTVTLEHHRRNALRRLLQRFGRG